MTGEKNEESNVVMIRAAGKPSDAKPTPDGKGGLRLAVVADSEKGQTTIYFGKPVAWIAMTPDEADILAEALKAKAQVVRNDLMGHKERKE